MAEVVRGLRDFLRLELRAMVGLTSDVVCGHRLHMTAVGDVGMEADAADDDLGGLWALLSTDSWRGGGLTVADAFCPREMGVPFVGCCHHYRLWQLRGHDAVDLYDDVVQEFV